MMKTRYRLRRFDSSATPESYESVQLNDMIE